MGFSTADSIAEIVDSWTGIVVTSIGVPLTAEFLFDWFISIGYDLRAFPERF